MSSHQNLQIPLRTAQFTGLAYVAMAISGALSYLVIRPRLFVEGDAAATLTRMVENESLARWGLVAELALITSGAITGLLFFALFRSINSIMAGALTLFGLIGAIPIIVGTISFAAALQIAVGGLDANNDPADLVLFLIQVREAAWSVAALPFGLWLIPMGWLAHRSGWVPRILGLALMVGGVGYIASAVLDQLQPQASIAIEILTLPASLAEFSMMIYLVVRGSRSTPPVTGSFQRREAAMASQRV